MRTPGPPPSSSMKSTPAASRARRTAKSLAAVIDVVSAASSARRMVASPKVAFLARSSAVQPRRARAALIWRLVKGLGRMLTPEISYDMIRIIRQFPNCSNGHFRVVEERDGVERADKAIPEPPNLHRRLERPHHH